MTKYILSALIIFVAWGCGGSSESSATDETTPPPKSMLAEQQDPLENKGIGPIKEVTLGDEIDMEFGLSNLGAEIVGTPGDFNNDQLTKLTVFSFKLYEVTTRR